MTSVTSSFTLNLNSKHSELLFPNNKPNDFLCHVEPRLLRDKYTVTLDSIVFDSGFIKSFNIENDISFPIVKATVKAGVPQNDYEQFTIVIIPQGLYPDTESFVNMLNNQMKYAIEPLYPPLAHPKIRFDDSTKKFILTANRLKNMRTYDAIGLYPVLDPVLLPLLGFEEPAVRLDETYAWTLHQRKRVLEGNALKGEKVAQRAKVKLNIVDEVMEKGTSYKLADHELDFIRVSILEPTASNPEESSPLVTLKFSC